MIQDMEDGTVDSILVKEGRVVITFLFHSNFLISKGCFYKKIMIRYTLNIYDFFSRKNLAST